MSEILFVNLSIASDDSYTVGPLTLLTSLKSAGIDGDFYDNLIHHSLHLETPSYYEKAYANDIPADELTPGSRKIRQEARARVSNETRVIGF